MMIEKTNYGFYLRINIIKFVKYKLQIKLIQAIKM
jgi:hypothetical protein